MSDMLDRIRHELQQRLDATRAAAQEHERVRAALDALEKTTRQVTGEATRRGRRLAARARPTSAAERAPAAGPVADAPTKAEAGAPSRARRKSATTSAKRASGDKKAPARRAGTRARRTAATARAPRGANRAAVLAVVEERPGVTASELAAASGVSGGTLYALLRRLTNAGEVEKRELPGGQTGYAVAAAPPSATPAGNAAEESPADRAPEVEQEGESQSTSNGAEPVTSEVEPGS